SNGKQILMALELWRDDVNAKGGLLGRPVELVYYDDQSSPSNVPALYTKLITVDKVDLLLGPYATNMVAPAMPVSGGATAKAADRGDRVGRRGVRQDRGRRRTGQRQGGRLHGRLRAVLPARDDRFFAGDARGTGRQPRCHVPPDTVGIIRAANEIN